MQIYHNCLPGYDNLHHWQGAQVVRTSVIYEDAHPIAVVTSSAPKLDVLCHTNTAWTVVCHQQLPNINTGEDFSVGTGLIMSPVDQASGSLTVPFPFLKLFP